MNRAERRRKQVAKKPATYNMTREGLAANVTKEMIKQRDAIIAEAAEASILAVLNVLHDQYSFGKKRIQAFMGYYNDYFDSVLKDYVSIEDFRQEMLKYGVRFEKR